ncbi:hypothetical protein [Pedobacter sp. UBA4863]|uniref:hypothetical protein n=1 Tax=Pedobacter sp. UBA4863 TaxID=1947060 RepID=UPI0025EB6221|nr:hypothetical protein [Pedobacter sp. UBA4863]
MENEEDYLANKAELEWQKQEERDKKSEEWEQYLESLSDDDIDDLVKEDKLRRNQNRIKREVEKDEEELLQSWKESNPEEAKIWRDKWIFELNIRAYSIDNSRITEFEEWKKWLNQRKIDAKEKMENQDIWLSFQKGKYESDIVEEFLIWSKIDENSDIFEVFSYFTEWQTDNSEEWNIYKMTFTEEWNEQDIRNFLSKGASTYSLKEDEDVFEIWEQQNSITWEKWKSENSENWKIKVHDLYIWTSWVLKHPDLWNKWAELKLAWWKEFRQRNRECEILLAWNEDHMGGKDEFELWKLENLKDWDMWSKELEDRIETRNWNE